MYMKRGDVFLKKRFFNIFFIFFPMSNKEKPENNAYYPLQKVHPWEKWFLSLQTPETKARAEAQFKLKKPSYEMKMAALEQQKYTEEHPEEPVFMEEDEGVDIEQDSWKSQEKARLLSLITVVPVTPEDYRRQEVAKVEFERL